MGSRRWAAGGLLRSDLKLGSKEAEHRAGRFQGVGSDSQLDDQPGQKALPDGWSLAVGWCTLLLEGTVLTKADRRRTGRRKKEAAKTSFSQRWNASDLVHTMKKAFIVCDKLSTSKDNSIRLATCGHTPFQHKVKLGWLMLYLYPLC